VQEIPINPIMHVQSIFFMTFFNQNEAPVLRL
jgi:hypothetical protein